jgi:O-antigen/teichoic acid export membrane protein
VRLILAVIFRGLGFVSSFIFSFVIAKSLSQDDAGLFFLVLAVVSTLTTVSGFGTGQLVVRYSAAYKFGGDTSDGEVQTSLMNIGIIGAAIMCLCTYSTISLWELKYHASMHAMAPAVFFVGVATVYSYALQGQGYVKTAICILTIIVPLGVSVATLVAKTPVGLGEARVAFSFISMVIVTLIYKLLGNNINFNFDFTSMIYAFKKSLPLWFVAMSSMVVQWGGQIFTGINFSNEDVAILTIAQRISMLVSVVLIGVNLFLSPKFAVEYKLNGISKNLLRLFKLGIAVSIVPALIAALIIIIFAKEMLFFISPSYTAATTLVFIFLLGQVVNSSTGSAANLLNMTGNEKPYRNNMIVAATLFFPAAFIFSNYLGITGVAIAVVLTLIVQNVLNFICVLRIFKLNALRFI